MLNLFQQTSLLVKAAVGSVGGIALGWLIYEIYHVAISFLKGGTNAQKRDEAKSHFFYIVIAGGLIGSSGVVLAWMLHLLPS